jgi:hypothetical protein
MWMDVETTVPTWDVAANAVAGVASDTTIAIQVTPAADIAVAVSLEACRAFTWSSWTVRLQQLCRAGPRGESSSQRILRRVVIRRVDKSPSAQCVDADDRPRLEGHGWRRDPFGGPRDRGHEALGVEPLLVGFGFPDVDDAPPVTVGPRHVRDESVDGFWTDTAVGTTSRDEPTPRARRDERW